LDYYNWIFELKRLHLNKLIMPSGINPKSVDIAHYVFEDFCNLRVIVPKDYYSQFQNTLLAIYPLTADKNNREIPFVLFWKFTIVQLHNYYTSMKEHHRTRLRAAVLISFAWSKVLCKTINEDTMKAVQKWHNEEIEKMNADIEDCKQFIAEC